MKIEVWSDYVCPFCYIGKRNLDEALKQLGRKDDIEVIFKSFELDPNAPKQIDGTINELIAKKYGMSIEAATENNNKIVESARQIGLELDFDNLKPTNTFDAHRLSFYAKEENKLSEYNEAVLRSYFTEGLNISDSQTLLNVADEVGLDKDKATKILTSTDYAKQVRESESEANSKGIDGVPYFVFDGKEMLFGAQSVEKIISTINSVEKS
mgnify:CR=1 FL=1